MELQPITAHTAYLPGATNIGVLLPGDGRALAVDTGLSKDAGRALRKALDAAGLTLHAIINTHHHADHIGGNAYLLRSYPAARLWAAPLEAALIEHPLLEPLYLHMGARPPAPLRTRWLLAEGAAVHAMLASLDDIQHGRSVVCDVDGVALEVVGLPGHTLAQVGIVYDGVCFAADSFFGSEVLGKHALPYAQDVAGQLASLERLLAREEPWLLPGHGALTPRSAFAAIEQANRAAIERATHCVAEALPGTLPDITARVMAALRAAPDMTIPQYAIFASAVAAHLALLEQQARAEMVLEARGLVWRAV